MNSEVWTAVEKVEDEDGPTIIFDVVDGQTGERREERRHERGFLLMMELGGYPSQVGLNLLIKDLPWRFKKVANGNIFLIEGE